MAKHITLSGLAKAHQERVNLVAERELPSGGGSDEEEDFQGKITAAFEENQSFVEFTGYPSNFIRHWVEIMTPFSLNARKRGPNPKSSLSDALLCYLTFLHLEVDEPVLAKTLDIGISQLNKNIERIRSILNSALKTKWPDLAPRPLDDDERPMPGIGLLIDTITTECYRPKGRFGEVKHYFDGHHKVYGLKTEVAVTAARPHVAIFASAHEPGSTGDYTMHKANFRNYLDYLRKTPEEREWDGDDGRIASWGALMDKEYIGPATDTPGERRVTPIKGAQLTAQDEAANKGKGKARVPVEQYFGRLVMKHGILFGVYKYDHSNFDMDFENCCMLTNEDISASELTLEDGEFYQKFLDARVERWNAAERKRKASRDKYKVGKKQKLEKVQKYVGE